MQNEYSEFSKFISVYNFQLAWRRLQHSTRFEVKDRLGLEVYSSQKDQYLDFLISHIDSRTYVPNHAENFFVPKRNRDKRRFAFLEMDDRLVYMALGNLIIQNSYDAVMVLADQRRIFANIPTAPDQNGNLSNYIFKRVFSYFSSRSNTVISGQYDLFVQEILESIDEISQSYTEPYLIRTDIAKYFHSIPHDFLIDKLQKNGWLNDKYLLKLLGECLAKWSENPLSNRGIPVGYETSDYLSNLYLTSLDEANIDAVKILRYVDDIYIFVENPQKVENVLNQLDRELSALSLERNISKTKNYDLRHTPKSLIENEIRVNLSTLRDIVPRSKRRKNSPSKKASIKRQKALLATFDKYYTADKTLIDFCEPDAIQFPSVIAFILYRLENSSEFIKNLAFCLLRFFPNFSKQATTCLARNFSHDDNVIQALWELIGNESEHAQVRYHSLEALIEIRGFYYVETYLLSSSFIEWHLHYQILDLFPEYSIDGNNYFQYFYDLALNTQNPFLRAKAIKLAFERSENRLNQVNLINYALYTNLSFFNKLAIYLWQKQIDIEPDVLSLSPVREADEEALVEEKRIANLRDFHLNFTGLFGFSVDESFPLEKLFSDIERANQLLLNARNAQEQQMNEFVNCLYVLTVDFLSGIASFQSNTKIYEDDLRTLLRYNFRQDNTTKENTGALLNYFDDTQDGGYAHPNGKKGLLAQVKILFRHHMINIHNELGFKLQEEIMYDVFICYNKKDEVEVKAIYSILNKNSLTPWMDKYDIRPGLSWQTEILNALDRDEMKAAIICHGNNGIGPWQNQEHQTILTKFQVMNKPVIPLILKTVMGTPVVSGFLANRHWVDLREIDPDPIHQLIFGITGKNPRH